MTELATRDTFDIVPAGEIKRQVNSIQQLMKDVMLDNTHYGKIPGCGDKPTLLQPGAQKLMLMFQLADSYDVDQTDMSNGHREYRVKCQLVSKATGMPHGQGMGMSTTMESKHRYRNVSDFEVTGEPIPEDSKERKSEYRKQGFGMKKVDGVWEWVRYKDSSKEENPDIADTYNTVLKMACKRALVAAVLNSLAASDIFTQDLEDLPDIPPANTQPPAPQPTEWQSKLGAKMREAKELGISSKGMRERIEIELKRDIKELNKEECEKAISIVESIIEDKLTIDSVPNDNELATEDIPF